MAPPARDPLERAVEHLSAVLTTRTVARAWFERYVAALGRRAVIDTANAGSIAWVHRRVAGSDDVLPLPAAIWSVTVCGTRSLQGLELCDGRQVIKILYDDDGRFVERSLSTGHAGRLVELTGVLARASDKLAESVAFVAALEDERHGPGRIHYPVSVPGGVLSVWSVGLRGCRRAMFDGTVSADARFVVADGLEGRAIGSGVTLEVALDAYRAEVVRLAPRQRRTVQTITDDYDDEGNLLAPGKLPPEIEDGPRPFGPSAFIVQPEEVQDPWRSGREAGGVFGEGTGPDPVTGRIGWEPTVLVGPSSDAPPLPAVPACVPHVVLPLEPSPERPPERGRWIRLLGGLGATRHVVRIEEREGFTLVGADLLGLVDLKGLSARLDRIDADVPEIPGDPAYQRFVRYRARQYRWSPASGTRAEGLAFAQGTNGPRFQAGDLDGDALQAMVRRQRRVPRPAD